MAFSHGSGRDRSSDGGGMSGVGGKRRSLLANAIESIGTSPLRRVRRLRVKTRRQLLPTSL
jgi:hypothetical protein